MNRPILRALVATCASISLLSCATGDTPSPFFSDGDVATQTGQMAGANGPGIWAPPSSPHGCQTDLLCAQPYNALVFGNYAGGVDVGGHLAIGGDLTMQSFSVGHQNQGGNAVVAGGMVTLANGSVHGNVLHGGDVDINVSVGFEKDGEIIADDPMDFDQCFADICGSSHALYELTPNGTTTVDYSGEDANINLSGVNAFTNVFRIDADDLSAAKSLKINVPNGATIVVNIVGVFLSLTDFHINILNGASFQNLVFNAPQAETIHINGFGMNGSLLACKADVLFENGQMKGTMVAENLTGPGEFHHWPFEGCLP